MTSFTVRDTCIHMWHHWRMITKMPSSSKTVKSGIHVNHFSIGKSWSKVILSLQQLWVVVLRGLGSLSVQIALCNAWSNMRRSGTQRTWFSVLHIQYRKPCAHYWINIYNLSWRKRVWSYSPLETSILLLHYFHLCPFPLVFLLSFLLLCPSFCRCTSILPNIYSFSNSEPYTRAKWMIPLYGGVVSR